MSTVWKDARMDAPEKYTAYIANFEVTIEDDRNIGWRWHVKLPPTLQPKSGSGYIGGYVTSRAEAELWAENAAKFASKRCTELADAEIAKRAAETGVSYAPRKP